MTLFEKQENWGIYIHIPTCRIRCPYCAFTVIPLPQMKSWDTFTNRILQEYQDRRVEYHGKASTLYFGGGTPSLMPLKALGTLIDTIGLDDEAEISIEANPEDISDDWLQAIHQLGFNRISLGVQSTNPQMLKQLGRSHTKVHLQEAVRSLTKSSLNTWSADLMFGLPNQTLDLLKIDTERLLSYDPPHLSLYGLTIEPGTPYESAVQRGTLTTVSDDAWREMYDYLVDRLQRAGLERYEVSNFAHPGHQSRHNRSYWHDTPYMGLGPSAHGYQPDGARWVNHGALSTYLSSKDTSEYVEQPSPTQAATDYLLSALRSSKGASRQRLAAKTRQLLNEQVVAQLATAGFIQSDEQRIVLTAAAFPIADTVISQLIRSLSPPESG